MTYTHIPNLKGLTKNFFKLLRPKGNLCGGGVTVLNPKYPRLLSGDTTRWDADKILLLLQQNSLLINIQKYTELKDFSVSRHCKYKLKMFHFRLYYFTSCR